MKKILLSSFVAIGAMVSAQAYEFETSQGYVVGETIYEQQGWSANKAQALTQYTVSNDMAKSGSNSLKLVVGASNPTGAGTGNVYSWTPDITDQTNSVQTFSADFYLTEDAGQAWFFLSPIQFGDDGSGTWATQVAIAPNATEGYHGIVYVGYNEDAELDYVYNPDFSGFELGAWNHIEISNNLDDGETVITVNGEEAGVAVVYGTVTGVSNYAVGQDDYDGLGIMYYDNISINGAPLAVNEVKKSSFSVYPNPTADFLNLGLKSKVESVQIYDMAGKAISTSVANNQVDVRNLAKGSYVVKVTTAEGVATQKFIKK